MGWKDSRNTKIVMEKAIKDDPFDPCSGVIGAKKMIKDSGLREVAMVFSIEGLETFDKMLRKSIKEIVTECLEDTVKKSVQESMLEGFKDITSGMQEGMKSFLSSHKEEKVVLDVVEDVIHSVVANNSADTVVPCRDRELLDKYQGIILGYITDNKLKMFSPKTIMDFLYNKEGKLELPKKSIYHILSKNAKKNNVITRVGSGVYSYID